MPRSLVSKSIDYDQVAHLYDACVTVDFDVPFFLAEAAAAEGPVLELMAGTGRVSLPLVRAGVDLTCVDYSEGLLAILRAKLAAEGLTAAVHHGDARSFDLGRTFELIFIAFNALAELCESAERRAALGCVRRHLAPAGRFICTLHNPHIRRASLDGELHEHGRAPFAGGELQLLSRCSCDPATGIAAGVQIYRCFDAAGQLVREQQLDVRFALIEEADFRALAQAEGFAVRSLYGDYARAPFQAAASPFMIWLLEKSSC